MMIRSLQSSENGEVASGVVAPAASPAEAAILAMAAPAVVPRGDGAHGLSEWRGSGFNDLVVPARACLRDSARWSRPIPHGLGKEACRPLAPRVVRSLYIKVKAERQLVALVTYRATKTMLGWPSRPTQALRGLPACCACSAFYNTRRSLRVERIANVPTASVKTATAMPRRRRFPLPAAAFPDHESACVDPANVSQCEFSMLSPFFLPFL